MFYYKKLSSKFYYILFTILILIIIFLAIFLFFYLVNLKNKEISSKRLSQSFDVLKLYSQNSNYTLKESSPFVIGIIKIDSIKLNYPILSSVSEAFLKIAPCRFAGPMPNKVGNLCIAGHNYIDNTFFAKISTLKENDLISIFDLSGNEVLYLVSKVYEVESNDSSVTLQNTDGRRKISLMTCNSLKGTRIIVEAYEQKK